MLTSALLVLLEPNNMTQVRTEKTECLELKEQMVQMAWMEETDHLGRLAKQEITVLLEILVVQVMSSLCVRAVHSRWFCI